MAQAPRPGTTRAPQRITIRWRDDVLTITPGDFGAVDDGMVRKELRAAGQTPRGLTAVFTEMEFDFGLDSLAILWWIGKRKIGQGGGLSLLQVMGHMTLAELEQGHLVVEAEVSVEGDDGDPLDPGAASPESSPG